MARPVSQIQTSPSIRGYWEETPGGAELWSTTEFCGLDPGGFHGYALFCSIHMGPCSQVCLLVVMSTVVLKNTPHMCPKSRGEEFHDKGVSLGWGALLMIPEPVLCVLLVRTASCEYPDQTQTNLELVASEDIQTKIC